MTPHGKRILLTVAVFFAFFAFSGAASAMMVSENGPVSSTSGSVTFGHGENYVSEASLVQATATSSGSEYNWSKPIGISAGALSVALCLATLGVIGVRQRKLQLGV